jgi:hypothetical protein
MTDKPPIKTVERCSWCLTDPNNLIRTASGLLESPMNNRSSASGTDQEPENLLA